jgi:hypothetical protein
LAARLGDLIEGLTFGQFCVGPVGRIRPIHSLPLSGCSRIESQSQNLDKRMDGQWLNLAL